VSTFTLIAKAAGSDEAPENTCAAIAAVLAVPAPAGVTLAIEVDVRLSADAAPVVIRDARLERTTNGRGRVADLTLERLRRLQAGPGAERIPTLEEAREAAGQHELVVDVHARGPGVAERIARSLRRMHAGALARTIVASEHASVVRAVRGLEPRLRTAATNVEAWRKLLLERARLNCWSPRGHTWMVPETHRGLAIATPRFVAHARHAGDDVWVFVVNEPAQLARLRSLGVSGFFTTRPAGVGARCFGAAKNPKLAGRGATPRDCCCWGALVIDSGGSRIKARCFDLRTVFSSPARRPSLLVARAWAQGLRPTGRQARGADPGRSPAAAERAAPATAPRAEAALTRRARARACRRAVARGWLGHHPSG